MRETPQGTDCNHNEPQDRPQLEKPSGGHRIVRPSGRSLPLELKQSVRTSHKSSKASIGISPVLESAGDMAEFARVGIGCQSHGRFPWRSRVFDSDLRVIHLRFSFQLRDIKRVSRKDVMVKGVTLAR